MLFPKKNSSIGCHCLHMMYKQKCSLCEIREGACIQCAKTSCFLAFHTTCARKEKLLLPMKSAHGSEPVTLTCYCDKHLPVRKSPLLPPASYSGHLIERTTRHPPCRPCRRRSDAQPPAQRQFQALEVRACLCQDIQARAAARPLLHCESDREVCHEGGHTEAGRLRAHVVPVLEPEARSTEGRAAIEKAAFGAVDSECRRPSGE